ncbi:MAG TPA: hypothetical protein VFO29_12690 [Candidatus Rubrimentiphilum sp.]|nr:hypothetical protein [Candidatus Rubrimentiphilum sp.]
MILARTSVAGAAAVLVVLLTTTALVGSSTDERVIKAPTSDGQIFIEKIVQVSAQRPQNQHAEVFIAQSPKNGNDLLACSITLDRRKPDPFTGERDAVYVSRDAGRHWQFGMEIGPASDPSCAFGQSGEAYFLATMLPPSTNKIFRSKDLRNWTLWQTTPFLDRATLLTPPENGEIAMSGDAPESTIGRIAGGASLWQAVGNGKLTISNFAPDVHKLVSINTGGYRNFQTFGTVGYTRLPLPESLRRLRNLSDNQPGIPNAELIYTSLSLTDGTVTSRSRIASDYDIDDRAFSCYPSAAFDRSRSRFAGTIYVAWCDFRLGHSSILIAHSSDGRRWSTPLILDDPTTGRYGAGAFEPTVAVNNRGVVAVFWYDRQQHPAGQGWDIAFRASTDGGASWIPTRRVSGAETTWTADRVSQDNLSININGKYRLSASLGFHSFAMNAGDFSGMFADPAGGFHPIWVDNHTNAVPQVWTTRVTVKPALRTTDPAPSPVLFFPVQNQLPAQAAFTPPLRRLLPARSNATDVSRFVDFDARDLWFDKPHHDLGFSLVIRNTAKSALPCPLYFKATLAPTGRSGLPIADAMPLNTTAYLDKSQPVWQIPGCTTSLGPGAELLLPIRVRVENLRIPSIASSWLRRLNYVVPENVLEWSQLQVLSDASAASHGLRN